MVTDTAPSYLYVYDLEQRRTSWMNKAYVYIFKNIVNNISNITYRDVIRSVHPDDLHVFYDALQQIRSNLHQQPLRVEYRVKDKSGNYRWVEEWMAAFERTSGGELKRIIGAGHEITERKINELQIRKLSKIVEQSPLSVVITDIDGNIEYVNQAFMKVTGYEFEEVKGQNPRVLKTEYTSQEEYKKLWDTISAKKQWNGEFYNKKKNGEYFWENASICPLLDENGKITHFIGIKEDITEKKRMEEERLQSQKMEAVGKLAGGIAHDLNNILTVIIANSDLVLSEVEDGSEAYESVTQIETAAERAAHLVRQLLAFSRKQILRKKVLDLNKLISDFEKMLRRIIGEDIILSTTYSPNLQRVKADPAQIEQVVMNLVINARDAMPMGGHLSIETQNIFIDKEQAKKYKIDVGYYALIVVSDTGSGMSEEIQKKIFEPFFTTKPIYEGAGLGLSMVFGVISQSGGTIRVKSAVNEGATFKVYLPAIQAPIEPEVKPKVIEKFSHGKETILIVEDEELIRNTISSNLKRQGYKTLTASDGEEALAFSQAYGDPIHILVTDVVMPNMSGKQLADNFLEAHPETEIIYMSGYADKQVMKHGIFDKDVLFIQKPFTFHELAKLMAKALKKEIQT
ncbi:PAS/PAC sensor hybrid histidine kinase [Chloroherpeton thalassium ATCC 35110]|uniref:histidine kinase n=1 Tax=Chloroherpeton thalassium (strain ATCC 35110 / GB-78) TaxID=517418 RepID=B3QUQ5_CHLT3|nr:PAS domain-containing sensor histidine kinase [Chloroherpeton thalassium]ACF12961.1 PAS/PAC sensor hybrid histidine kinase [Chloroherpeton thalassium ATCC 35110]